MKPFMKPVKYSVFHRSLGVLCQDDSWTWNPVATNFLVIRDGETIKKLLPADSILVENDGAHAILVYKSKGRPKDSTIESFLKSIEKQGAFRSVVFTFQIGQMIVAQENFENLSLDGQIPDLLESWAFSKVAIESEYLDRQTESGERLFKFTMQNDRFDETEIVGIKNNESPRSAAHDWARGLMLLSWAFL